MGKKDRASTNNIEKLIKEDKLRKRAEPWTGTLLEFMKRLRDDPEVRELHKSAHGRVYDAIMAGGSQSILETDDPRITRLFEGSHIKTYGFFENEFFGIEPALADIAQYFEGGAKRGEESRQFLFLWGPPGCGKSTIISLLRHGLETHNGGIMFTLAGSQMPQDPLLLVPKRLRADISKEIGVHINTKQDVDPKTRKRLLIEFNGEYERFPVETKQFSMRNKFGISITPPVDPNNQDIGVLIGELDLSKMDRLDADNPELLVLNGAFNVSNRGLLEFVEIFQSEPDYLHTILTATQDGFVMSPGNFPVMSVDVAIVAASNEPEFKQFLQNSKTEGLRSRMVPVRVPYNLRVSEEVRILGKMINMSEYAKTPVVPHTREVLAMFSVMTRLKESNKVKSLLSKMKIYDGEELVGDESRIVYEDLVTEAGTSEGMSGISYRFAVKAYDQVCSRRSFADPITIREVLLEMLLKEEKLSEEEQDQYKKILTDIVHKEYLHLLEQDMTKAFVHGYAAQAETLFQNYLDNAEAFANKKMVKDKATGEELEPDIKLLEDIESGIGITGNACDGFRDDVQRYVAWASRRNETLSYKSFAPLKEAVEKYLYKSVKRLLRVVTKATIRNEDQQEKHDAMVEKLIEMGYPKESIELMVTYAGNNLWK